MKNFFKAVRIALMVLAALKGVQMLADKIYAIYGQKYIRCDLNDAE